MTHARAAAFFACLILIAGSATAESTFESSSVSIDGRATIEGGGGAVFILLEDEGILWDGEARSARLERTYATWSAVLNPANDEYAFQWFDATQSAEESFDAVMLEGGSSQPGGALLVRALGPTTVTAISEGLRLTSQTDPRFDQGAPADVEVGQNPDLAIHEQILGDYVNGTMPGGIVEIRGDVVLTIYGLDYDLAGTLRRTGEFTTSTTGNVVQGTDERHVVTLMGATLRLRALSPVYVHTDDSVVSYVGTVEASDGSGMTPDGGSTGTSPGRWTGASSVSVSPAGALLAVRGNEASTASAGAIVAQGPSIGALAILVLSLATLVIGAVLILTRERPDDLQLALLAMEERRWRDALPRLSRVASRRPQDVGVLVDRALCMEQLGRHKEAARAFEQALRAGPRNAEAHFYYARTLARLQQREAGLVHLETALEIDPRLGEMAHREPILRGL